MGTLRILGIDPSLVKCGWGMIAVEGSKLIHIAHGVISPNRKAELPLRLQELHAEIDSVIADFKPDAVAVEEAFMKDNAQSALKLGQARAACIIAATRRGLPVGEYSPRSVKQAVVGTGGADKAQVAHMVNLLLPNLAPDQKLSAGDAADALAIAICHSNRLNSGLAALSP